MQREQSMLVCSLPLWILYLLRRGLKKEKNLHNSLSHSKQMNGNYFYTSSTGPLFHFDKA